VDYKDVTEVLRWHAINTPMSGAEARVLVFMATGANHKTGRVQLSYKDIAEALGLSKVTVANSVHRLVEVKALQIVDAPVGRSNAVYRVRTAEDMALYYLRDKINPEADLWASRRDALFGELVEQDAAIGRGCDDCKDGEPCPMHAYHRKTLHNSTEWREYLLWLSDNPKPEYWVKAVHDKVVKEA
jgi:DNA-binding Lrp family transcriptional regulator